ncbi:redoxin domain-containing protein [Colwellia psychrerythraea]|uniref:Alkyl hydroperoxide reductase/ Thiol specific antioxidant/ Mal allergen n=1 Tax=Colwellia psychrerythraea TaxID=28229 RepID=A0A099KUU2_COLPS|nr:redoxin domain-containing protein [Colwellia psychrerythraea]KGJ93970.1 alkyl hydroperoxide reductase/ Thiol specific antioxidant/ Mal allergen [Colwellia psychrerythraea]
MPSLTDRLRKYKNSFEKSVPAEVLEVLSRNISLLQKKHSLQNKLNVGSVIEHGQIYGSKGHIVELDNVLLQAPIIINFIRGAWCPYCMLELQQWHKFIKSVDEPINFIVVSGEISSLSDQAIEDNKLGFPIWEDKHYRLATKFGLTYGVNDEMKELLLKWGIDLTIRTCIDDFVLPTPATYIIDKSHTIRYAFLEEDYTERAEPLDVYNEYKKWL